LHIVAGRGRFRCTVQFKDFKREGVGHSSKKDCGMKRLHDLGEEFPSGSLGWVLLRERSAEKRIRMVRSKGAMTSMYEISAFLMSRRGHKKIIISEGKRGYCYQKTKRQGRWRIKGESQNDRLELVRTGGTRTWL